MAGYGGESFALFARGNFAMVRSGRYALIQFRKFSDERREAGGEPLKLAVSEDPYGDFRCSMSYTRATAMYAGGKNKEYAKYFMAYLASEEYNMNIVNDGDALPPNPEVTKTEEYLRPADRPEEWHHPWGSVHETFAELMAELGVAPEFSPFVLDAVADRFINEATDKYMNKMLTLEEATANMQKLINEEIRRSLGEDPSKQPFYNERLAVQKQIDELRAAGEKVPLSWITNPYWRHYYILHNLAEETK
jgi:multiple sugar transport system substrate-binding protein